MATDGWVSGYVGRGWTSREPGVEALRTPPVGPTVFDCDLHTHSRFFHRPPDVAAGVDPVGARLLRRFARRRGLDGVAITNHDYFREDTRLDATFLPGIEISTSAGHLLVVGPEPPARTRPGELDPEAAVELAHDRGCAAIVAHPFRNSTLLSSDAAFDAIEVNGKHPEHLDRIVSIGNARDLLVVGGSDAHFPFEVGRISTRLEVDRLTPSAVVSAIRDGRVEPVLRDDRRTRAMRAVYTRIHRLKGQLEDPFRPRER